MERDQVIGTAVMPLPAPYPLNLNATIPAAAHYFVEMAKRIPRPSSVLGPGRIAKEFARLWCEEVGCDLGHEEAQAIHKLELVNSPNQSAKPKVVTANESHRKLLEDWSRQFCVECESQDRIEGIPRQVSRAIETGSRYLLLVEEQPVCMAGKSRESANGGSINAVYTPKNLRGKGYASVLVAWLSQNILDSGKKAVYLYTQLVNPTSNKIYYDLGYRVISDSWHIRFRY
jgi:predicted GNAT family acetyltransferase